MPMLCYPHSFFAEIKIFLTDYQTSTIVCNHRYRYSIISMGNKVQNIEVVFCDKRGEKDCEKLVAVLNRINCHMSRYTAVYRNRGHLLQNDSDIPHGHMWYAAVCNWV